MDETAKNLLLTIGVMIGFFCIAGLFISDDDYADGVDDAMDELDW